MVFIWFWHGVGMVLAWGLVWFGMVSYGFGMILVCFWYGVGMVLVWFWYDFGMDLV